LSCSNYVSVGIVGVGNIGGVHASVIYSGAIPGMKLAALCDNDPEKLKILAEKYPDIPLYSDYTELIRTAPVDAVIIAVPHRLHPEVAVCAFGNGLHVLSEKPLGVEASDALRMIEAWKQSGRQFCVMFNQRTDPLFGKAREIIKSGLLGERKRFVWIITNWYRTQAYYNSGSWRATWNGEGGGVLLNQAPHNIDLWMWLFGLPARVRGFCYEGKYHHISVEDDATIYAEYDDGATGVFITSTGDAPGTNRLEITGDRGKMVLENGRLKLTLLSEAEREFCFTSASGSACPPSTEKEYSVVKVPDGHNLILENFASAILHGTPLISPGEEGINELMLSNAAYLSSWTDSWVELPLDAGAMNRFEEILDRKRKLEAGEISGEPGKKSLLSGGNKGTSDMNSDNYNPRWQVRW